MSDAYVCGCRGTVHDPTCWHWKQAMRAAGVTVVSTPATDTFEQDVLRKLDRIISLLELLTGQR